MFNRTSAGMTYRLYAFPKMHSSRALAEADEGQNTLLHSLLFAPAGLDVDFPLTWRPASMAAREGVDENLLSIDTIPFIVVTYESSTRLFRLTSFLTWTKYKLVDNQPSNPPLPEQSLFAEPPIELPYVRKRDYADHVRITSAFKSAFLVWFDSHNDWLVLPTRYDTHLPAPAPSPTHHTITTPSLNQPSSVPDPRFEPHVLGSTEMSQNRLCLNPSRGMAFYMEIWDRRFGYVHMWEWIIPPPRVDSTGPLEVLSEGEQLERSHMTPFDDFEWIE